MFYYDSVGGPSYVLYMGKDKFENEDLIRWGWPEDVWFHVDKLSSAHVYLRLPQGVAWDAIPADVLQECCQLVKANSIEGVKLSDVDIIYTPWSNLKKTGAMDAGQVSYHNSKLVKRAHVTKDNVIVNKTTKTRREVEHPQLQEEREQRDSAERRKINEIKKQQEAVAAEQRAKYKQEKDARSYDHLMKEDGMVSNSMMKKMSAEEYEDDFM